MWIPPWKWILNCQFALRPEWHMKVRLSEGWRQSSETIIWILCKYRSPSQTPAAFAAVDSLNIPIVRRFSYLRPREFFSPRLNIQTWRKFAGINRTENGAQKIHNVKEKENKLHTDRIWRDSRRLDTLRAATYIQFNTIKEHQECDAHTTSIRSGLKSQHNISSAENRFFSFVELSCICLALLTSYTLGARARKSEETQLECKNRKKQQQARKLERMQSLNSSLTLVPRAREVEKRVNKKASRNCQSLHYSFALLQTVLVRRIYLDRAKMFAICIFALLVSPSVCCCCCSIFSLDCRRRRHTKNRREPWHLVKGESETLQFCFSGGPGWMASLRVHDIVVLLLLLCRQIIKDDNDTPLVGVVFPSYLLTLIVAACLHFFLPWKIMNFKLIAASRRLWNRNTIHAGASER